MFSGGIKIGGRNKATVKCCGKTLNLNIKVIAFTVIDPLKKGVQKIFDFFYNTFFETAKELMSHKVIVNLFRHNVEKWPSQTLKRGMCLKMLGTGVRSGVTCAFKTIKKTLNRKRRGFECNILKEKVNGRIYSSFYLKIMNL